MALKEQGTRGPTSAQLNAIDPATNTPISKYSSTLNVPPAFPAVLKDFTREVLRYQPSNIYKFAVAYFTKQAEDQGNDIADKSKEEAAVRIQAVYRGFSTRKKIPEKKESTSVEDDGTTEENVEDS